MKPARILVVDDDQGSRTLLARILAADGHEVLMAADGREAIALGSRTPVDLVVSDIRMLEGDGLLVLDAFKKRTPVILMTAFGNVEGAVDAIRRGAFDYISKPYDVDSIRLVVGRALVQRRLAEENRALKDKLREKYQLESVVGRSEAMLQVFKTAARVAQSDATVLVLGESGTGKERVARAIHQSSARAEGPFVAVDCGAMAEGVIESELFGHARGAFTGAVAARRGLFEEASGGTLFLDEVGNLSPRVQAQLLRVLQEGEVRRVGESQPVRVDARVVAATNRDLRKAVAEGTFREDLYWRLAVVTLELPPLRERREDVPLLVEHFVQKHGQGGGGVAPEAMQRLLAYDWPGNVRELENVVARALALSPSRTILLEDLPEAIRGAVPTQLPVPASDRPTLAELDHRYAQLVLAEVGGNKTRAAEILGIDRKTLYRLLGGEE